MYKYLLLIILYSGQWSPFNKTGKKCYDIGLLKQMKDDPLSKNKPNVPLLEACNVMRVCMKLLNICICFLRGSIFIFNL